MVHPKLTYNVVTREDVFKDNIGHKQKSNIYKYFKLKVIKKR